jgi:hypothetical protein
MNRSSIKFITIQIALLLFVNATFSFNQSSVKTFSKAKLYKEKILSVEKIIIEEEEDEVDFNLEFIFPTENYSFFQKNQFHFNQNSQLLSYSFIPNFKTPHWIKIRHIII